MTLICAIDSKGLCSQDAGASKTGVKLENKADESLSLQIDVELGDGKPKPSWSQQLLGFSQPLGSDCIPLPIAGLEGASGTATPTAIEHGFGRHANNIQFTRQDGHLPEHEQIMCWWNLYLKLLSRRQFYHVLPGRQHICAIPDNLQTTRKYWCMPKHKQFVRRCSLYLGVMSRRRVHPVLPSADSSPTTCAPPGKTGICQDTSSPCAGGAYVNGYCSGDNSIKCCPNATPTSTGGGGGRKMGRNPFGKRIIAC